MRQRVRSNDPADVPVLVVGAGPAGLVAALTLARHGVMPMLVERRHAPSPLPRATAVSTRCMEILRSLGVEQAVWDGGVDDVEWVLWRCESLARVAEGEGFDVGLPTAAQSALVSPTRPACAPQDHVETVLLDALRGAAHVALGTELVEVESRRDGVRATLRDVVTGELRVVDAGYLVAADGWRSGVRSSLEIPMLGSEQAFLGAASVFEAPLWDLVGEHRYGIYGIMSEAGDGVFLPAGRGDRWGYGFGFESGERVEVTEERIRVAAGVPDLPLRMEQVGTFAAGVQIAERYREGRAFLVGDAAHRLTPRGGVGMNTAIQDAYDLAWKLAWVVRGWGADALLDSYEADRRPVAEHNLARSADPDGSVRPVLDELAADLGGRMRHVWVRGGRSTLDLLGAGYTLFTGPGGEAWRRVVAGHRVPVEVRELGALPARALGLRPGGAMLARPDGVPEAWWPTVAEAPLAAAA